MTRRQQLATLFRYVDRVIITAAHPGNRSGPLDVHLAVERVAE